KLSPLLKNRKCLEQELKEVQFTLLEKTASILEIKTLAIMKKIPVIEVQTKAMTAVNREVAKLYKESLKPKTEGLAQAVNGANHSTRRFLSNLLEVFATAGSENLSSMVKTCTHL